MGKLSINDFANAFIGGVKNMAMPCMMVSLCKGVTLLMGDSKILDTIIHFLAGGLSMFPQSLLGFGMFIVQDVFNLVVPSGSGQAAITMPIMAPLADLVGDDPAGCRTGLPDGGCLHQHGDACQRYHHDSADCGRYPAAALVEIRLPAAGPGMDLRLCGHVVCYRYQDRTVLSQKLSPAGDSFFVIICRTFVHKKKT